MSAPIRKIVIASDSFKGCLSSMEVAESVEAGIKQVLPECEVVKVEMADGGEGTARALTRAVGGELVHVPCHDPLGRTILAYYGLAGETAIVGLAAASGLPLLSPPDRNPMETTTFGTGEIILAAIRHGCRKILLGLGGSATNDAGTGLLHALGYRFIGRDGRPIGNLCGKNLAEITGIEDTMVPEDVKATSFIAACDVDNPFCGKKGAAFIFAPQKGADENMVKELDEGLKSFASVIERKYGTDITEIPGTGAAGGTAGACMAILDTVLRPGAEMVLDAVGFDNIIEDADLIITGEGRIDSQTAKGKAPAGVLARGIKANVPVIAIGGSVEMCPELDSLGFIGIYTTSDTSLPPEINMRKEIASSAITQTIKEILIKLGSNT